ncbi:nuclease-related domain-containing protein [Lacisediminihabitans profunda]|uniref:NERD domain-containing protein n=1 Tax=Lacisediminihabitans profunda TaxID=2594790 RepID=A0A5C8UUE8_9MICO|nr:nuclease-related domain-containing protein [Lacisediminihabitans profunda]TXN31936.1 NERD domain-containing protein [Lacisediminihabitans profunda]
MTEFSTMRSRPAAQSLIEKLLALHDARPAQSGLAKLFGLHPLNATEMPWYVGARGEIAVARALGSLPTAWTVLHSVPVGKDEGDIDHVLVGPAGVFTISTKHHSGKRIWVGGRGFFVSGRGTSYIDGAESEAASLGRLIASHLPGGTLVRSMIVLVDPGSIRIRERPEFVTVIDARHLVRWLVKQPVALGPAEIADLAHLLDNPAVWRETAEPAVDTPIRFAALDAAVRSAAQRQTLWAGGGVVLLVGAGMAVASRLLGIV